MPELISTWYDSGLHNIKKFCTRHNFELNILALENHKCLLMFCEEHVCSSPRKYSFGAFICKVRQ